MTTTQGARPRPRTRLWWTIGVVGVSAMTALAVWFGLSASSNQVHWYNGGFSIVSDQEIDIRFDVTRDGDRAVLCQLHALDAQHARVGTGEVVVDPTPGETRSRHIESLRTVARATTGYVDSCDYLD